MTSLAIKASFKKFITWCKTHWELLLGLAIGLAAMFVFRKRAVDLTDLYQSLRERSKKEQTEIEAAYQQQVKEEEAAALRAVDALKQVEEEYQKKSLALDRKKRAEVKKEIESAKHDPEELARKLAELTGATFVS